MACMYTVLVAQLKHDLIWPRYFDIWGAASIWYLKHLCWVLLSLPGGHLPQGFLLSIRSLRAPEEAGGFSKIFLIYVARSSERFWIFNPFLQMGNFFFFNYQVMSYTRKLLKNSNLVIIVVLGYWRSYKQWNYLH